MKGNKINSSGGNTKNIAKNSFFLYVRMFVTMALNFIASRYILQNLGVEDYGIYNVVGGIVLMFSFLNTTMAGATSRFINYELGKQSGKQERVFTTALTVHLIIAIFVVLLCETFGYWFLNNKMVIPADRMYAAKWVLQFSIITIFFSFTQVPFNATIIAYEKMHVFAFFEMGNSVAKLIIILLLALCTYDRLIVYGVALMLLQIAIVLCYQGYCYKNFEECKIKYSLDKEFLRPMLLYSVWDLFGNGSLVFRSQGVNMLLNLFFGPIINASTGIASQVQNLVLAFSRNVTMAFKPQVVKNCAQEDYDRMSYLIIFGANCTFLLFLLPSIPLIANIDFVLRLWLKEVPDYCSIFCQLAILMSLFGAFSSYPMMGIDATGRIRTTSIILGVLYTLVIPLVYIFYKFGCLNPVIPYIYNCIAPIVAIFINSYYLHKYIGDFSYKEFLKQSLFPGFIICTIDIIVLFIVKDYFTSEWTRLIITTVVSCFIVFLLGFYLCFDKQQRQQMIYFVKRKIRKV